MLYIRVDMNETIATGHVMRCLSIAYAARCQGEETTFLLADSRAVGILKEWDFPYIILNTCWNEMDSELPVLKNIIFEREIECLLIDSYQVTENYLRQISDRTRTVYIDDVNSFLYPVDAIICYASYWKKFQYDMRYPGKGLLLGPAYVPLRKEFSQCSAKQIKPEVENLVLVSGGTDRYDVLNRLLGRIEKENYKQIVVICGTYYPKYEHICEKYKKYENVKIFMAVRDMKFYLDMADLIVTAGGTTLYEICAVGTPAISYSIADNQLDNAKSLHEDEIIDYAGDARWDDIVGNILSLLKLYHRNYTLREKRSFKMQALIDGEGARRIAEFLVKNKNFEE